MGAFTSFGTWINENTQQPLKAESKSSENVKSKSRREMNTHGEKDEMMEQLTLGRKAEKKKQWNDPPPKVKDNISRKIVSNDGTKLVVEAEKEVVWNIRSWSRPIPITLLIEENEKDLSVVYMKKKMTFMKKFNGSYKVEPIFVDSERLCNNRLPKSRQEYEKCSGGQGKIASKVTMDQYFQPSSFLNLPPFSWYIRWITIKTTKDLVEDLQIMSFMIRGA